MHRREITVSQGLWQKMLFRLAVGSRIFGQNCSEIQTGLSPTRGCLELVRWVGASSFSPKTLLLLFIPGGERLKPELFEALKTWFLFCLLDIPPHLVGQSEVSPAGCQGALSVCFSPLS